MIQIISRCETVQLIEGLEMILVKRNNGRGHLPSVFSDFFDSDRLLSPKWFGEPEEMLPAVNIKENGKRFEIELAAPGFSKDDFKISVDSDILTITAEKEEEKKEVTEEYRRREFSYNAFSRSFTLPKTATNEKIDAKYENGLLKLVVPKKEEAKLSSPREIAVS